MIEDEVVKTLRLT